MAVYFFPLQVFRDCDDDDGGEDSDDNCHAFVSSWLTPIASLVYTVVRPLSKVSESGVFMIVNNKGKLATPQRSCCFFFFFLFFCFVLVGLL